MQKIQYLTEVVADFCLFRLQAAAAQQATNARLQNAPYGCAAVGGIQDARR
jgi:hypothetical protein